LEKLNKTEHKSHYHYQLSDTLSVRYYHGKLQEDGRKFLLFNVVLPLTDFKEKVTLEKVNDWNLAAVYSRAYLMGKDDVYTHVILEVTMALDAGVSRKQLDVLVTQYNKESVRFVPFVGGPKNAKEEKKAPKENSKNNGDPPQKGIDIVRQGFPADRADENDLKKSDTAWEIEWDFVPFKIPERGVFYFFRIAKATFEWKDSDGAQRSLVVLRNLFLAEAFTQYDDKNTCFLDIAKVGIPHVPASEEYLGPACVAPGSILPSSNPTFANKVHREMHYDGLRWMSIYDKKPNQPMRARKGEKLVLWSAIQSGNYAYLMEYNFTDDGRIVSRLGFTAHSFFDRAKLANKKNPYGHRFDDADVHPHIGCWRFDFDLSDPVKQVGGSKHNELTIVRRIFDKEKVNYVYAAKGWNPVYDENGKPLEAKEKGGFVIKSAPFPGNPKQSVPLEGKAKWIAEEFTTLRAESSKVTNKNGKSVAYDLISTRTGTAAKRVWRCVWFAESCRISRGWPVWSVSCQRITSTWRL
jgi:hypothetical protein